MFINIILISVFQRTRNNQNFGYSDEYRTKKPVIKIERKSVGGRMF